MLIESEPQWGTESVKTWTNDFNTWRANQQDLQYLPATLTHEFGHTLGFGHPNDDDSVMSGAKNSCDATNLNCLSSNDREALRTIYRHQHRSHE